MVIRELQDGGFVQLIVLSAVIGDEHLFFSCHVELEYVLQMLGADAVKDIAVVDQHRDVCQRQQ